jgi:hypothetical protein
MNLFSDAVDKPDDHLGHGVARRGLSGKHRHARHPRSPRVSLDFYWSKTGIYLALVFGDVCGEALWKLHTWFYFFKKERLNLLAEPTALLIGQSASPEPITCRCSGL